jgi:hypothetical protein
MIVTGAKEVDEVLNLRHALVRKVANLGEQGMFSVVACQHLDPRRAELACFRLRVV